MRTVLRIATVMSVQPQLNRKNLKNIVDETVQPSPMKVLTRSKSQKVVIPQAEALICSDAEDELLRQQQRKRNHASPEALRARRALAGEHAKYFRRNSNHFPSVASQKLTARRGTLEAVDENDQFKTTCKWTTCPLRRL